MEGLPGGMPFTSSCLVVSWLSFDRWGEHDTCAGDAICYGINLQILMMPFATDHE
jgi:hypothetical protein